MAGGGFIIVANTNKRKREVTQKRGKVSFPNDSVKNYLVVEAQLLMNAKRHSTQQASAGETFWLPVIFRALSTGKATFEGRVGTHLLGPSVRPSAVAPFDRTYTRPAVGTAFLVHPLDRAPGFNNWYTRREYIYFHYYSDSGNNSLCLLVCRNLHRVGSHSELRE